LGIEGEDPGVIGDAIHANTELMDKLIDACRIFRMREFTRLTEEEFAGLTAQAEAAKSAYMKKYAEDMEG